LKIEEVLKTDKTNNLSDNIKDDDGGTPKEKLKDIPNTDNETYGKTVNNSLHDYNSLFGF